MKSRSPASPFSVPEGLSSGLARHFNGGSQPVLMLVTEPREDLADTVEEAISGGVNIVQLRDKCAGDQELLKTARRLREITAGRALLVVNGNARVAAAAGADGVHLPEQGESLASAREIVGEDALIGRSVHSIETAWSAERDGADYFVAGTIFASNSHPGEPPAGVAFLREVCSAVSIPVIAIGGVTPENIGECVAAGAAGVAVLSPIMRAAEPKLAAEIYRAAMLPSPASAGEGPGVGAS